jgi:hypothetical protein
MLTSSASPLHEQSLILFNVCHDPQPGQLFNPLIATPDSFDLGMQGTNAHIRIKKSTVYAKFFIVGLLRSWKADVTGSAFRVTPIQATWGRISALLGAVFNLQSLYFASSDCGLNFSTKKKTGRGQSDVTAKV